MDFRIALAGNPNSGKTTLFNALTGSNQFVGNWPGVTVEKKEGKLKKHSNVVITDLPGIYSLSPYTLEEVVARNYLINERPDAILNIIDGTNLERNLYLTTQLTELGIPVVVAINMMDVVKKNGDRINTEELSRELGCKVVEISALKGTGIMEAAEAAVDAAENGRTVPMHTFSGTVEHALAHIEEAAVHNLPEEQQRWYAIKIFERDEKVLEQIKLDEAVLEHIETDINSVEDELDDDAESIITNERYIYIGQMIKGCYNKKTAGRLSTSDKIDRVVTNRFAALPIFAVIMFLVYYIAVSSVGTIATDWANDGVFGDGWHLAGIGTSEYDDAMTEYAAANVWTDEMIGTVDAAAANGVIGAEDLQDAIAAEDFGAFDEAYGSYADSLAEEGFDISGIYESALGEEAAGVPDPSEYGIWVPGIPVLVENGLAAANCPEWLNSLLIDGIIGGVGAVLGFVPQMIVLFILLAFLESCGYMARIAFVLDRIFRKFGLSGKSFIPMLIGTGCGVPGVMASRTIENERDRRMTIMTTTFIPCGAKLPIIALIASALFGGAGWVAPSAYFIGIAAIVVSGIMLKKTRMFAGDPAPFVMELPAYHWPTVGNVLRSMWERAWSFIKKAGTIILLASIVIWAGSCFGMMNGSFTFSTEMELEDSVLGMIGKGLCWIFAPLGFGNIKATVATIMGLVAKEEVVGVFGVLDFEGMTQLAAYSFLVFNLLCAPCFAAIGAIRREMNSAGWTWFAIGYQCVFAYAISLLIYQFGSAFTGSPNAVGLIAAVLVLAAIIYMLFIKKYSEATKLTKDVRIKK
ncbi:MAG: ferrous iron transporter B [Firmicutes bacterium]|nr:ferrous iron transporter B [Bacillota bacterium]MDY6174034.1 ferrous iron transporter B [Lentihominibacter sp.]